MNNEQYNALSELEEIMDELHELSERARRIQREAFPEQNGWCEAYRVFDFGWSCNQYDNTLETLIETIPAEIDEQERMAEEEYAEQAQDDFEEFCEDESPYSVEYADS